MSQNGKTHFKNLAAFAARFFNVSDHFGALCIKGLKVSNKLLLFMASGTKDHILGVK